MIDTVRAELLLDSAVGILRLTERLMDPGSRCNRSTIA
jgi:hypothetical protein